MYLDKERFKQLVEYGVLFSIDLVVLDEKNRILLGERTNAPAQGYWFVPGGRVFKAEPLFEAFQRICLNELGLCLDYKQAYLLGLFDHFYDDSVFGNDISTHYVNAPYLIRLNELELDRLPHEQHKAYRWLALDKLEHEKTVHSNSKLFLYDLKLHVEKKQDKGRTA